jgi:hypothetical protein
MCRRRAEDAPDRDRKPVFRHGRPHPALSACSDGSGVPTGFKRILEDDNGCRIQDEKAAHRARSFGAGRSGNARDIHATRERP